MPDIIPSMPAKFEGLPENWDFENVIFALMSVQYNRSKQDNLVLSIATHFYSISIEDFANYIIGGMDKSNHPLFKQFEQRVGDRDLEGMMSYLRIIINILLANDVVEMLPVNTDDGEIDGYTLKKAMLVEHYEAWAIRRGRRPHITN